MSISSIITAMTKNDAIKPIIALEATVVTGRTVQAYKRGGSDEARERFIEESIGSIVWLCGVQLLNKMGDKILGSILKNNNHFDVGTDKVLRTPFDNFIRKFTTNMTQKKVAILKGAKVLSSIAIANLFIGFVVPKINHALTHKIHLKNKEKQANINNENYNKTDIVNSNSSKEPSFRGVVGALNVFTNAIENTNTGKLLSTDFGIAGGRMVNARNNEERREIGIRDLGSIYFYMWAQGHVRNLLNFAQTGNFNRLDPSSSEVLTDYLNTFIKEKGGELSVAEFKKQVLGKDTKDITLPEGIKFEEGNLSLFNQIMNKFRKTKVEPLQVAKVEDLEKIINDETLINRIKEMSKLQPLRKGEAVVTKQQIIDAINNCEINNPKLLNEVFHVFTGGMSQKEIKKLADKKGVSVDSIKNESAFLDEFKFVSNKKLYNLKKEMEFYIERLCKNAKDGKITEDYINKFKNRNTILSGINFAAGFSVAALFLSVLIPKFQYWVTRVTTGRDDFPGTYNE